MNNMNELLRRGWILAIILYYAEVSITKQKILKEAIKEISERKNNAKILKELKGNVSGALEDLRWDRIISPNYQRGISLTKKGIESIEKNFLEKFDEDEKEQLKKNK